MAVRHSQQPLKKLRRNKRVVANALRMLEMQTLPTPDSGWDEIEAVDARLDADRLNGALSRLSAKCREAVRLRIFEQLDYNDIATRLNCKPATARSLVFRGLRRLRYEFDSGTGGEELL